jgi:phage recombination protein Bet
MAAKTASKTIEFTPEQVALIKSQIAPKATNDELQIFLYQCKRTGLDPLTRQIYCIHRKSDGKDKMTIQTSIDGFRVIAERSGDYGGQCKPKYTYDTNGNLISAEVTVYRFHGEVRYECATAEAFWREYVVTKDEWINGQKTGKKIVSDMWAKMSHTMLAKVAEALALRKSYPQDLSGLYTTEETAQMDNVEEAAEIKQEQKPDQKQEQKQLPPATPFNPQYTPQAHAQPVPAQKAITAPPPATNTQALPAQQQSRTPFNQAYNDLNAFRAAVKAATKIEDLNVLYTYNKAAVDTNEESRKAIAHQRDIINNQGKVIITDQQFKEVCNRITKGDTTVYDNAVKVYILNPVQLQDIQMLHENLVKFEDALKIKYQMPQDIETMINTCYTTNHILSLHANNAMIIDRDKDLTAMMNNKIRQLKSAA